MNLDNLNILGIDIGSISISIAELNHEKRILNNAYTFHRGEIRKNLIKLLTNFNLQRIGYVATTSSSPAIFKQAMQYDSKVSLISAAKNLHQKVGSIIAVGGEKFGLISFDESGDYLSYKSNTSCAAGTGGFLDQQANRLNLEGIRQFCQIAAKNQGDIPQIASRCAVFAKTDLIHAQQEGYTLEEICDGLSFGLAKNIVDTLSGKGSINSPLLFAGGVSKNLVVLKHIAKLLNTEITVSPYSHLYGAIGAAINLMDEKTDQLPQPLSLTCPDDLLIIQKEKRSYHFLPLKLTLSQYPEFNSFGSYQFNYQAMPSAASVEVDIYHPLEERKKIKILLGLDIGSTSTKAIIIDKNKQVLAGFYTKTAGQPIEALQSIFAALDEIISKNNISLEILAVGTTGSGRKFIGQIVGADLALDEITAHARAAFELDPEVDTIIEIGGQDSKFTNLKNGAVTFSVMNNVCAAGTGSFIEEMAKKMNCPLEDYSAKAENSRAPLASDRCTVFMERDLNHYLNKGYSSNEVLASVLHSVRENYLTKVATENSIGEKIFFQGATAKNKALVSAFEQRLEKPIMVSKYCHLTGALGVALDLSDKPQLAGSRFKGIDLYKQNIPVKTEVCQLCANHCKLKIANVGNEKVAFGFLCGKDYQDKKRIEKSKGFDLLKERKNAFKFQPSQHFHEDLIIGLPPALHLFEDLPFWQHFFDSLSIKTLSSQKYKHAIKEGTRLAGAEFCAPMAALHGHLNYLADKVDYIFLPDYLEVKQQQKEIRRQYCYYTQYAAAVVGSVKDISNKIKLLNPLIRSSQGIFSTKYQLYKMLKTISQINISLVQVSSAYDKAVEHFKQARQQMQMVYKRELNKSDDISVVLIGRPYTILSPLMNNSIPDIFVRQGIKPFSQEMLSSNHQDIKVAEQILKALHWNYGAQILEAAEVVAHTPGVYPVLITSFKCTPDSYIIEYFKTLLQAYKKPYLILQLDEHDSSVGYETRIEAAIRSFRNHHQINRGKPLTSDYVINSQSIKAVEGLEGKTLFLPNWDRLVGKLMEAILRKEKVDARLLEETEETIQRSLRLNTGQCLPLTAIVQGTIDYINKNNIKPENAAVWCVKSQISCSLGIFPFYIKKILDSYGQGMEKVSVYQGEITFLDFSLKTSMSIYLGYMFAGMLKRMGCKIRPYEKVKGTTDAVIERSLKLFYQMFLHHVMPQEEIVEQVVEMFKSIPVFEEKKVKVAIFGDLYSRDNCTLNQDLIKTIEENGGEVITTAYTDYVKIIGEPYIKKWFSEGLYRHAAMAQLMFLLMPRLEKRYYNYFNQILQEPDYDYSIPYEEILAKLNVKLNHTGESMENILKIFVLKQHYPDLALFVQANPSFCCPSLVTEAMSKRIEELAGIPIVTIEYDGTGGIKNDAIIPYLKFPRKSI